MSAQTHVASNQLCQLDEYQEGSKINTERLNVFSMEEIVQEAHSLARAGPIVKSIESRLQDLHATIRKRSFAAARGKAIEFVRAFGSVVNFSVTPQEASRPYERLLCDLQIKFSPSRLRGFDRTLHVMVSSHLRPTKIDYTKFKDMVLGSGLGARIFFLINPGNTPTLKAHASSDRSGLVVLDATDIREILTADSPRAALNRTTSYYVDIDDIQPYDYYGEARGPMFFGHQKQLKRILTRTERSFAVFGGRRVGKTSLLRKVETELNEDRSTNSTIFLSAQGLRSNVDLCAKIVDAMLGPKVDREARAKAARLDYFTNFVRHYVLASGQRWTIFIDEIDDFVFRDKPRRQEVMATLRALDSELGERCRFVFAGFRILYESLLSYHSPVMNFVHPITLDELDFESARKLVLVPIEEDLGYQFRDSQFVDKLIDYSSRHPCHIQRFCSLLLRHVHRENRYTIEEQDVDMVFESPEFRNGLLETFYWNTTASQKLIIYLLLDSDAFTVADAYSALIRKGVRADMSWLINDLTRLVTFGHLRKARSVYVFAHEKFPTIVKEAEPVDTMIHTLLNEVKQRQRRRG